MPMTENLAESPARAEARTSCVRAGAHVLKWRAEHGTWPDGLNEAMSPAATDPFSDQPLKYRQEGAGFVVYSPGPTGKFTGGTPGEKKRGEAVFRYPARP